MKDIEQYKKGEPVEVSEDGIDWCNNPKEFLCEYENKYWCKDNSEAAFSWNQIRKIKPKQEIGETVKVNFTCKSQKQHFINTLSRLLDKL